MPKSIRDRRKRCIKGMLHKSPLSSPHSSGIEDEGEAEDLNPKHEVIHALMGLGSGGSTGAEHGEAIV